MLQEAIITGGLMLVGFGALAGIGLLGIQTAAWISYRFDGGKLGLIAWIRGI